MTQVLEVAELTTTFPSGGRRAPVVDRVSFSLSAGEVLALVGESGCGKSQTALSLLRLVPKPGRIEGGTVHLSGVNVLEMSVAQLRQMRGRDVSMIFQEPMTSLNPVVPVGHQVVEAIRLHERVSFAVAKSRVVELFSRVRIPDAEARFSAYPHQLSGGLKQRIMIAMALSTRPKLLIADEPTTALDVTIQAQILTLLRELSRDFGTAVLLITHDFGVVNELADRVAVMYAGRILEAGSRKAVLSAPAHPYTQGLLAAIPSRVRPEQPLAEIPGVVPPLATWQEGCRFRSRCPRALPACDGPQPPSQEVANEHWVHCYAATSSRSR